MHEGADTTALSSATDPATDFGKIVTGVNDNVDAIVSGHTHLAYNHSVTVPAWVSQGRPVTTRPVVSAGQYGYNLDQLLFTVDPTTDKVVGLQQSTLPLVKTPAYPTDAPTQAIVDKAVADAAVLGAQPLGQITGPFNRAKTSAGAENRGGESTLGNLVAEVQQTRHRVAHRRLGADRLHEPGRPAGGHGRQQHDLPDHADLQAGGQRPAVRQHAGQPEADRRADQDGAGAAVAAGRARRGRSCGWASPRASPTPTTHGRRPAAGSPPCGSTAAAIDPAASYSVTVNSFLAAGGDNFGVFAQGTNKKDTGQTDLQAMVDYMEAHTPCRRTTPSAPSV